MKSICIEEIGKVTIREQEMPVRKEGEALLKLLYGGICDLGTGTGIVPLILAHKTESRRIVGVEIQRDSWDRA